MSKKTISKHLSYSSKPVEREDGLKHIKDKVSLRNLGVSVFNSDDLQEIKKNTGKLANYNEFQIHYWFLCARLTMEDDSKIDIAIPTVYFNYKQEVSSGHISFELSDVDDASEALEPIHNMKVNSLMRNEEFISAINSIVYELENESKQKIKLEWISQNLGQIHRHP